MRYCSQCKTEKPAESFGKRSGRRKTQYRAYCKKCEVANTKQYKKNNPDKSKTYDLKKMYGITLDDKKALLIVQNNCCAGCGSSDHKNVRYKDSLTGWHVDHNHATGKVRGLLCSPCNLTLGNAEEDLHRLIALTAYLAKHTTSSLSELAVV